MGKCVPQLGFQPIPHAAASTAKQQQSKIASAAQPDAGRIKSVRPLPINANILYVQRPTVQQHRQVKQNANVVQLHAVVSLTVVGVKPLQYLSNLIFFYPLKKI
jgi:hypothetical protein